MSNTMATTETRLRSSSFAAGTGSVTGSPPFIRQKQVVRRLRSLTEHKELGYVPALENIILKIPNTPLSIQPAPRGLKVTRSSSDSCAEGVRDGELNAPHEKEFDGNDKTTVTRTATDSSMASDHRFETHPHLTGRPPELSHNRTFASAMNDRDRIDQTLALAHLRCRRNFRARCSLPAIFCGERIRYLRCLVMILFLPRNVIEWGFDIVY